MLKKVLSYVWAVVLLFAIVPGCNSNPDKMQDHGADSASKSETINTASPVKQAPVVVIEQMKFVPDNITVKKGDTITFINKDIVPHDITEATEGWKSGKLDPGSSWRFAPQKDENYFCSIHVVMKGRIKVQ
ncbi:plastocyanin/azurin family copper-binding protein [Niabella soli]|uniref:plastocyanin/azurin family copper-binding protein n=1 Tax=Niabella soli TaxID=446683 RepID=UPI00024993E4|nr:plastocyanin/azurin family copper-binding protein [Niabella soli]